MMCCTDKEGGGGDETIEWERQETDKEVIGASEGEKGEKRKKEGKERWKGRLARQKLTQLVAPRI
jgi:hypothetical protein